MIPPVVLTQCREQAETAMVQDKPTSWIAAVVVVAIWLLLGFLAVEILLALLHSQHLK